MRGGWLALMALLFGGVAGFGAAQLLARGAEARGGETDPSALGWRALRRGELAQARAQFARVPKLSLDGEADRGMFMLQVLEGDACAALTSPERLRIKQGGAPDTGLDKTQAALEAACQPLVVAPAPAVPQKQPRGALLIPAPEPRIKTAKDAEHEARLALMVGQVDKALHYAAMGVGMEPKNPRAHEILGKALGRADDYCRARDAYQEALDLGLEERIAINVRNELVQDRMARCP